MHILVTGGAGYIGSHTCLLLLQAGFEVSIIDNLCNSHQESIYRIQTLTGKSLAFHQVDLLDKFALQDAFNQQKYDAVIHFAGLKSPTESVSNPLEYYQNNVTGTLNLCQVMASKGVKHLVFSSSAAVYNPDNPNPQRETSSRAPVNPYGRTKQVIEDVLIDLSQAAPEWQITILRYFNPVGAHDSGKIGEDPRGIPNNLLPYICQVAIGRREFLNVYGSDYSTPDGTGVRDYIHVMDLAKGHIKALETLAGRTGTAIYNLGTGRGYSVMEVIQAFEQTTGIPIPYRIVGRRPGDVAASFADPSRAIQEIKWTAKLNLEDMCRDAWRWQMQNPQGYK